MIQYKNNLHLAKRFLQLNPQIKESWIWREGKGEYHLMLGNEKELSGFKERIFSRLCDAKKERDEINKIILSANSI